MSIAPDFMNPAEFRAQQDRVLREQRRLQQQQDKQHWAEDARKEPHSEVPPMPQHDAPSA